jgi:hypothetical protein
MTTLPQPISRLSFLVRFVIAIVANILLYLGLTWGLYFAFGRGKENVPVVFGFFSVWLVAFILLVMCFIRFVVIARLTSIGINRWYALLILVPYVGVLFMLFLLFCPVDFARKNASQPD